jgi:DNA-3-methyladenine glycosylase II
MKSFNIELKTACSHLSHNDHILAKIITKYGAPTIVPHTNYYEELVSSIISQQLSVKAAATIWNKY